MALAPLFCFVCLVSCSEVETTATAEVDVISSLPSQDGELPERTFPGLDPLVKGGPVWDSDLSGVAETEDTLQTLLLFPSAFDMEMPETFQWGGTPFTLLERVDPPGEAIAEALRSGNFDLVRVALTILERHSVPLGDHDRTAEEIIRAFEAMSWEVRDTMNREMDEERWSISPTYPGQYYLSGESLRLLTPDEKGAYQSRYP